MFDAARRALRRSQDAPQPRCVKGDVARRIALASIGALRATAAIAGRARCCDGGGGRDRRTAVAPGTLRVV
jgi:hypothetical protein